MKVLIVGYHNPHFMNTVVLREKAVGYLGHEVFSFDDAAFLLPGTLRGYVPILQRWDLARLNEALMRYVRQQRPDKCVVVGGQHILPGAVSQIRRAGVPIALWTTDVPVDFNNILEAAGEYSHLFCAGTEALEIFHAHGFNQATWLPFACDPNFHHRLSLSEQDKQRYAKDIVFVGSFYPNRERVLESIADYDLGVWGPYWHHINPRSPLKPKSHSEKINYDQWVKIYNACKINLVIHYQDGKVPCHQASPKLFEAMACGCCVLTDRQKDVEALFQDQRHVVFFDDGEDLRRKITYYLKHGDDRRRIADAGQAKVVAEHTYTHRITTILEVLS